METRSLKLFLHSSSSYNEDNIKFGDLKWSASKFKTSVYYSSQHSLILLFGHVVYPFLAES